MQIGSARVIDKEYTKTLVKMASYRNRMVHLYNEIGSEEIYDILKDHLSDIERFIYEITNFIKRYQNTIAKK